MEHYIPFLSSEGLEKVKHDFFTSSGLAEIYKSTNDTAESKYRIQELLKKAGLQESSVKFTHSSLIASVDKKSSDANAIVNAKKLYNDLKHLTPSQAAMEKIWVALLNTHYLEYHLSNIQQIKGSSDADETIWNRTFASGRHGPRRHLLLNNLSHLWWIAHLTYDKSNQADPYHLTEFFMSTPYIGNSLILFSSNINSNSNIILGILEGVKQLVDDSVLRINRYAYSDSVKIINTIAGVKLIDLVDRSEIRQIIIQELPKSNNITLTD